MRRGAPARRPPTSNITPKGQRAFRDAQRRHAARVAKLFATLSPTEFATLMRLLDKLRAGLREPEIPPLSPARAAGTRARAEISGVGKRKRRTARES